MGFFGWFKRQKQGQKFCKDCKHMSPDMDFRTAKDQEDMAICLVSGTKTNLVTGEFTAPSFCAVERKLSWLCGPTGKNFQPKENQ